MSGYTAHFSIFEYSNEFFVSINSRKFNPLGPKVGCRQPTGWSWENQASPKVLRQEHAQ